MAVILRQDEKLIKAVRRHWVFLMPIYATAMIVLLLLILIKVYTQWTFGGYFWWSFLAIAILFISAIAYKTFIWKRNVLILTNQRMIEVRQTGLFTSATTEMLYRDILEVSFIKKGLRAQLYGFGHIKLRTASNNEILIENIPSPHNVVEIINSIR